LSAGFLLSRFPKRSGCQRKGRGTRQLAVNRGLWLTASTKVSASHQIKSAASDSEFRIDEVFENKPEGLEQSFIIHEKIADRNRQPADRPLKIVLGLSGDLQPEIAADGQTLIFTQDGAQEVLRSDKLKSGDAGGRELASRMEISGSELSLVVDDAEAVYPVTIDPAFTQVKRLVGSDSAAQDAFGFSVAVSGNTAVVGAIGHKSSNAFQGGAAYTFEGNVESSSKRQD